MLLAALALARLSANPTPLQILASPTFARFAAATDAACPGRRLRYITPGELDLIEEDFIAAQPRRDRTRIAAANGGDARCAGRNGLACSTTATLDAFAAAGATDRFATFACRPPPR